MTDEKEQFEFIWYHHDSDYICTLTITECRMAEDDIIFRNKKGSYDNRKHNNFRLLAVHCLDFPLETGFKSKKQNISIFLSECDHFKKSFKNE